MKLTCAVVEDDTISRSMIEALAERSNLLTIGASFATSTEAMTWLNANKVDLLFLDIEMPDMSGIELLRVLVNKPEVIIVSSKPDYAINAFEFSVVDYLLKPVKDYGRFLMAVNKVISKKAKEVNSSSSAPDDDHLYVKIDSLLHKIRTEDILWAEAFGDYVKIQTKEKQLTAYSTLKKLEERLPQESFMRVHRSYIVNLNRITNIDSSNLEIDKKIIPVSDNYKQQLLARIRIL